MTKPQHTVTSLKKILNGLKTNDSKNIPFDVVIEAFSDYKLIPFNRTDPKDTWLLKKLRQAIQNCIQQINTNGGIVSKRVNEVGNKMEEPVINAINALSNDIKAERPKTASGQGKSTGYPDILIYDKWGRPTYLEVKTYNTEKKLDTTLRSFYLSPSDNFKITCAARHLLVAFSITKLDSSLYLPEDYKLAVLDKLKCNIKFEINSNNKRLYAITAIL